jgi:hypothetical protein
LDTGVLEGAAKRTSIETRFTFLAKTQMSARKKEYRNVIAPANSATALFAKLPVLFASSGMSIIIIPDDHLVSMMR